MTRRLIEQFRTAGRALPGVLAAQQNGIAFLAVVPFMLTIITLAQRDQLSLQYLLTATPQSYSLWAATILLGLTCVVLAKTRSLLNVPPLLAAIILFAIAIKETHKTLSESQGASAWLDTINIAATFPELYGVYTVSVIATAISIVWRPTLSDWLFRTVAILLLVDMALFAFGLSWSLLDTFFLRYVPSPISILTSLLVLMFFRMIIKFLQENATHFHDARALTPETWRQMARDAVKLWWPMLLVFVSFGVAYHWLDERYVKQPLIRALNTYEVNNPVRVYPTGDTIGADPDIRDYDTVEEASKGAMRYFLAQQYAQMSARIDAQVTSADQTADQVMEEANDILPLRFPGTRHEDCGLDIKCAAANVAKSTINSSYLAARSAILADLRARLDELEESSEDFGNDAKALLRQKATELSGLSAQLITETATGLRYLGLAAFIYSLVILIKSLMIVFARVFHSQVATTPAASGLAPQAKIGTMTRLGPRVEVRASDGIRQFYAVFRACGNNVVDRRRIPQPTKLILRRITAKNWTMCLIDFDADETISTCDLIVDPPAEITQWDLAEGDEVFVDMSAVVGFSASCRLDRQISLSLGALIFGRAIYHSISGPGRVFLRTDNAPLGGDDPGTENVMQSSSLIAWRRDTGFHVKSSLTVSDTFFSGYSVRKADPRGHLVLYDTSQSRRVGTGGGIIRMTRAFLLPF